jgi:mono/diheme cytochrome c family protein
MQNRFWSLAIPLCAGVAFSTAVLAQDRFPGSHAMSPGWEFAERGGLALYTNVCAACHQPDAKGATGGAEYPTLVANTKLASSDYLLRVLLNGLRGMPPVGRMMSDQQVADVINYVRTHFGNAYHDAVSAADVKAARPQVAPSP